MTVLGGVNLEPRIQEQMSATLMYSHYICQIENMGASAMFLEKKVQDARYKFMFLCYVQSRYINISWKNQTESLEK